MNITFRLVYYRSLGLRRPHICLTKLGGWTCQARLKTYIAFLCSSQIAGRLSLKYSVLVQGERSGPTGAPALTSQPRHTRCYRYFFFPLCVARLMLLLLLLLTFFSPPPLFYAQTSKTKLWFCLFMEVMSHLIRAPSWRGMCWLCVWI